MKHRRTIHLILDDEQAASFDTLRFLDGPTFTVTVLTDWLEIAALDPDVIAAKKARRLSRSPLHAVRT